MLQDISSQEKKRCEEKWEMEMSAMNRRNVARRKRYRRKSMRGLGRMR